jgi:hypothetical protein
MEKDCPAQIVPLFTPMIGLLYTIMLLIALDCDGHPAALVPDSV